MTHKGTHTTTRKSATPRKQVHGLTADYQQAVNILLVILMYVEAPKMVAILIAGSGVIATPILHWIEHTMGE